MTIDEAKARLTGLAADPTDLVWLDENGKVAIRTLLAHTADYDALKGRLEDGECVALVRRAEVARLREALEVASDAIDGTRFPQTVATIAAALTRPDEPTKET